MMAAVVGAPADVVKARIMHSGVPYSGSLDCLIKTVQHEGVMSLWRGFLPTWMRLVRTS